MNAALLVSCDYPEFPLLRRELSGTLVLRRAQSVSQARSMLSDPCISILILDFAGEAEEECGLLRWVDQNRPGVECIALVEAEHFCAVHDTRRRNLYRLLKPTDRNELRELILRTAHKVDRVSSGAWARDPMLLRRQDRQFWEHLLTGVVPPSEQELLIAAPPTSFRYQEGQTALPLLFCLRRWHQRFSPRGERDRRYGVKLLAERTLLRTCSGCSLPWPSDSLILLLYGPDFPDEKALSASCRSIVSSSALHFGCDVACYYGSPCPPHQVPDQMERLLNGERNNVTDARAVLSLRQLEQQKEPLSLPVLRDWMPYFINGQTEEFCRCIESYFQQAIAANNMDRSFLARFQQDFVQEVGFALKNAGIPLHALFSGTDELVRMEEAIRYVPDMMEWVRASAGQAIRLMNAGKGGLSVAQRVCDYLNRRLVYPFQREDLSRALHLSEGHIARAFKQEMGMTISEYLTEQRISLACLTIRQTNLPLTQVAEQCGFRDYPYFYKSFKHRTGMSPTEYQQQMRDIDM